MALHNPINYKCIKIVKSGSHPLDDINDFQAIKSLAASQNCDASAKLGVIHDYVAKVRIKYLDRVLDFVDVAQLKPMNVVIN